jgi:hypothetical protein
MSTTRIQTIPMTAAAQRTLGAPSFVVSQQMSAWPGTAAYRVGAAGAAGAAGATRAVHAVKLRLDVPNPSVRDSRVVTKQDRPPRGVPR